MEYAFELHEPNFRKTVSGFFKLLVSKEIIVDIPGVISGRRIALQADMDAPSPCGFHHLLPHKHRTEWTHADMACIQAWFPELQKSTTEDEASSFELMVNSLEIMDYIECTCFLLCTPHISARTLNQRKLPECDLQREAFRSSLDALKASTIWNR